MSKLLFDYGFKNGLESVVSIVIGYLFLIVISGLSQYQSQKQQWKVDRAFCLEMKKRVFKKIYFRKPHLYSTESAGEYVSVIDNNIPAIMEEFVEPIIDILKSLFQILIYGIILFILIDYRIGLIVVLSSIVSSVVPKITAKRISRKRKTYLAELGKYNSRLTDLFTGNSSLDWKNKNRIQNYHGDQVDTVEEKKYFWGKFKTFTNVLNGFVMDFFSLTAFTMIGILYINNQISIGDGVATLGYIESFIYPVKYILNDINALNSSSEIFKELEDMLCEDSESTSIQMPEIESIELKNLCIEQGDFYLKDFSYLFEAGKYYVFVGASGSGKSTIFNVLTGKAKVKSGQILVNGIDVTDLMDGVSMDCFSVVEQKPYIFDQDYLQNVSLFESYSTENLKQYEAQLPEQLSNRLKQIESAQLSGGEKQVLCLLRAALAKKSVLLLDEVTSAIDQDNKKVIRSLIQKIPAKIKIEISHSEIEEGAIVLRFDQGKVYEI